MAIPKRWSAALDAAKPTEGGQAYVFPVTRADDDALYALKCLKNPKRRERFSREVSTMVQLRAEGLPVPEVIDSDLEDEHPWYVMPWYRDGSLEDRINSPKELVTADDIRTIRELAAAIASLHDAGFSHRDLKPANILLNGDELILADFGLSLPVDEAADRLTELNEGVGPRLYIAPENESGMNNDQDQRPADCYAFAKLAWVLLSHRHPLSRELQLREEHQLHRTLGPELEPLHPLFTDLLDTDPRSRLTNWQIVDQQLAAVEEDLRGLAGADTAAERAAADVLLMDAARLGASPQIAQQRDARERYQRRHAAFEEVRSTIHARQSSLLAAQMAQVTDACGGALNFELSGDAGHRLTEVATVLKSIGLEIAEMQLYSQNSGPGSMVLMRGTHDPLPDSLYLALFVLDDGRDFQLLRVPMVFTFPGAELIMPPPVPGLSLSPQFRPGLATFDDTIDRFLDDTADVALELARLYVTHVERGESLVGSEPWGSAELDVQTPMLHGLERSDRLVLMEIAQESIREGQMVSVDWDRVCRSLRDTGLPDELIWDGLQALGSRDHVDVHGTGIDFVQQLKLTSLGLEAALPLVIEQHDERRRAVIAELVANQVGGDRVNSELADRLNLPQIIVDLWLDDLNARDLIKVARSLGGHCEILSVSTLLDREL